MLLALVSFALSPGSEAGAHDDQAAGQASWIRHEDYRVARVGYRLGEAGARHCPVPHPLTGLLLHHITEYSSRDRAQAIAEYALDRGPGVLAVVEDSPAARAGIAAGDVLLSVGGTAFPSPLSMPGQDHGDAARRAIEDVESKLEAALRSGPARLVLLRGGSEIETMLVPKPGCPARVRLARSGQNNAFANRGYAIMTTSLLSFLKSDDELAVVLGHEIAHNILGHPERLEAEGVPHGLFRGIGRNAVRVRETEVAADALGLKLASAAGYDAAAAIPYWRRYYARFNSLRLFPTHPGLKEREQRALETLGGLKRSDARSERP